MVVRNTKAITHPLKIYLMNDLYFDRQLVTNLSKDEVREITFFLAAVLR
ncbi:hypothetical protein NSTC745_07002 [Nostoc sp. DSM 114161]|jgi:hypothetical protein